MPSEFDDRELNLQRGVQQPAPNLSNGPPDGALTAPAVPSLTPWLNPADGPIVQTETTPPRLCVSCQTPVPLDATSCPRCGRFAPENKGARRRLRKSDVEKLLAELKTDYRPQTTVERHDCEALALILAERKATRPGTTEYQRLLEGSATLRASLEASRAAQPTASLDPVDLDSVDGIDQAIERTRRALTSLTLLRRARG